jgi:membrane protein required for colicin V production
MPAFTSLDILVLLLVGGGLVFGYIRGFVTEVMSLLAWVVAIAAVKVLHAPVSEALAGPVGTNGGAAVLAFAIVFLIFFFGVKIAAQRIGGMTRTSFVGPVDRLLGAGFGALKGIIGATVLYLLANLVYDTAFGRTTARPEWMTESRTYPLLNASSRAIVDFIEARRRSGEDATNNAQAGDQPENRQ